VWDSNWHSYLCNSEVLPSVPNAPCGVERFLREAWALFLMDFLMHSVESNG